MLWKIKPKTQSILPGLALLLVILGQLYYLPARLDFVRQLLAFTRAANSAQQARMAYRPADYDLLAWAAQKTPPETTLLLLTASPRTYGDPSYVLYHRAMYHLYPRNVWWAAPVPRTRYPAWWLYSDLSQTNILEIAQSHHATALLSDGFARPPVPGAVLAFDADTFLIFPVGQASPSTITGTLTVFPDSLLPPQNSDVALEQGHFFNFSNPIWAYLQSLLALVTIWLWGDALCGLTTARHLPPSLPRRLAAGWLLGCGITSLSTFILLWAGLSLTAAVTSLSLSGCLLWLIVYFKRHLASPAPLPPCSSAPSLLASSPPRLLFTLLLLLLLLLLLAAQLSLVAFAAWASPLTDWDAWVNWAGKANAIYIDQTLSPNIYSNPARLPTNMDYPLLLPLVEAWFYTWLGQIHEPVIGLISVLFYGALLLLFYDAARQIASPAAALGFTTLLATIPRLERPAHSGLADIPLAALVLLSFMLVFEWHSYHRFRPNLNPNFQTSNLPALQASIPLALSAGFLPWLKNEGWLWWILVSLSLLVGLAIQVRRNQLSASHALIFFLTYLIPALTIPLLWQGFLTMFKTYRFTFMALTLANFWTNLPRLAAIGWKMLTFLLNPYWNFVWLFAGLILVSRSKKVWRAPAGWLILPVAGYLGLISVSYVFSRFEPYLAQVNNSAERLIIQAAPLALWWLIGQCVSTGWIKSNE